ncbi:melanocyte-stimulating hormone receptor-like [Actinia tenebrosa]|uniref:Melanocyte-stimulating hormone receptor-like n=1 Tax=Actinia tenebrosa TaxID=6105 RepID=A0A6P8I316_ACTTE|nr:melanocyte-stimulating hormone receptor-like [Actinia tenebrosa]
MNSSREPCPLTGEDFHKHFDFYSERFYITSTFCAVVGVVLSPLIVISNGLVLLSILQNITLRRVPSNILICLLSFADFLVGGVFLPLQVAWMLSFDLNNSCLYYGLMVSSGWFSCSASFLCMVAVSGERYLALFLHLKYKSIVTARRLVIIAIIIWFLSAMISTIFLLSYVITAIYITMAFLMPSLGFIMFTYYRIFKLVRYHQKQIHSHQIQETDVESAKQRKLAIMMAYVIGVSLICYGPIGYASLMAVIKGLTVETTEGFYLTLSLYTFSSLCNPLIYCRKNREIRQAVLSILPGTCWCRVRPGKRQNVAFDKTKMETTREQATSEMKKRMQDNTDQNNHFNPVRVTILQK